MFAFILATALSVTHTIGTGSDYTSENTPYLVPSDSVVGEYQQKYEPIAMPVISSIITPPDVPLPEKIAKQCAKLEKKMSKPSAWSVFSQA